MYLLRTRQQLNIFANNVQIKVGVSLSHSFNQIKTIYTNKHLKIRLESQHHQNNYDVRWLLLLLCGHTGVFKIYIYIWIECQSVEEQTSYTYICIYIKYVHGQCLTTTQFCIYLERTDMKNYNIKAARPVLHDMHFNSIIFEFSCWLYRHTYICSHKRHSFNLQSDGVFCLCTKKKSLIFFLLLKISIE